MGYAVVCDNTTVAEVERLEHGHEIISDISEQFKNSAPIVQVVYLAPLKRYEITTKIDEDRIIKLFGEQPCSGD